MSALYPPSSCDTLLPPPTGLHNWCARNTVRIGDGIYRFLRRRFHPTATADTAPAQQQRAEQQTTGNTCFHSISHYLFAAASFSSAAFNAVCTSEDIDTAIEHGVFIDNQVQTFLFCDLFYRIVDFTLNILWISACLALNFSCIDWKYCFPPRTY